jgi:hypothetical protein
VTEQLNILNQFTGHLTISGEFSIAPKITSDEIIAYFGVEQVTVKDIKNGWVHYYLRNILIDQKYFAFVFLFCDGDLKHISFGFNLEPVINPSWDDWSVEKELEKKVIFDNWLTFQIGAGRTFDWGEVGACNDIKTRDASITLRYRQR